MTAHVLAEAEGEVAGQGVTFRFSGDGRSPLNRLLTDRPSSQKPSKTFML